MEPTQTEPTFVHDHLPPHTHDHANGHVHAAIDLKQPAPTPIIRVTAPSTDPVPNDFLLMVITNGRGKEILRLRYDGLLELGPGCQPTAAALAFEQAINLASAVGRSAILPFRLYHDELSWWKKVVYRVATWLLTSRKG